MTILTTIPFNASCNALFNIPFQCTLFPHPTNTPRCLSEAHRKRDEVELASFHRRLHDEKSAGQKRYDDLMLEKTRSDERVAELEVARPYPT